MAPRVVLRQPLGATPAVETVSGAGTVQRAWRTPRPSATTSEPPPATGGVISGHRRGTTDRFGEESPLRSTNPTPAGPSGVDVDRLIEAIEERVMAEIERRGGRYTGLF